MACNHCSTKFNFFRKELGCSNCGLSLCGKCLNHKCKIPSKGTNIEYRVCRTCFGKLSVSPKVTDTTITPPKAFIKRIEKINKSLGGSNSDNKVGNTTGEISEADKQIMNRLEKLRGNKDKPAPPSEYEIRQRLAILKDENEGVSSSSKSVLPSIDRRTDAEKVNSLLEQFSAEQKIEVRHDRQEEIEARLAKLRDGQMVPQNEGSEENVHETYSCSSSDSEPALLKKIMNEVAIESRLPKTEKTSSSSDLVEDDPNEFPWCVLCNDDATVRCIDCGGDLYCNRCNREVHTTWDKEHNVVPFKNK